MHLKIFLLLLYYYYDTIWYNLRNPEHKPDYMKIITNASQKKDESYNYGLMTKLCKSPPPPLFLLSYPHSSYIRFVDDLVTILPAPLRFLYYRVRSPLRRRDVIKVA